MSSVVRSAAASTFLFCGVICLAEGTTGKELFASNCARCHGEDGAGGEFGPTLVDMARSGQPGSPAGLRDVIRNGIPGSGMPPFALPEEQLNELVAFLQALRSPAASLNVPGDPLTGEKYFFGDGKCSTCHMVHGRGGTSGPALSNLGRERKLAQIEQALDRPGTLETPGYRIVSLRLRDGRRLRGFAKNENIFNIQLQTLDGVLHPLRRDQIAEMTREAKSLMPPLHATATEKRDLLAYLARLAASDSPDAQLSGSVPIGSGISFARIVDPQPDDWPSYNGRLSANRHSLLTEITPANVRQLGPKWIFPVPNARRLEVTPVVVDGIMYITTANQAYAVDATSGRPIWHYARPLTKGVIGDAGSAINRGVAVLGDRVFMVTDHAHLIALHRITGDLLWDTAMADYREHYGATSAPLVVKNLVISGTSGGDEGARGFIDAYDATTGKRVWRFWTMPKPGEAGSETWVGRAIEHGCGAAWLTGSYDADTNLIYWAIGNPCPDYNGDERKGVNLYTDAVVALQPDDGRLRWFYQFTPHDLHDWDAAAPLLLADIDFRGRKRKALMQANRNGFFYLLDRVTGEFILAEPFVKKMTWAKRIGADGRPELIANAVPTPQGTKACPAVEGATNWMSTAFNPQVGLYYVMALEACGIYTKSPAWWEPGQSFYGGGSRRVPDEKPQKVVRAIDPRTGKIAWEIPQIGSGDSWGGLLSTASGLLFFMDDSGALAAVDGTRGDPLWHFQTNHSWHASPMTYRAAGRQYVAVAAGSSIIAFGLPE